MDRTSLCRLVVGLGVASSTWAAPASLAPRAGPIEVISSNFPDPGFVSGGSGKPWYGYGTNSGNIRVQVATSPDFNSWSVTGKEALPTLAGWETEVDHWAPDVIQRNDGKFVLYYSGEAKAMLRHHCVGAAVADDPAGPFVPRQDPFVCDLENGGAIDSSGFWDKDGSRYVVYKVDGNSIGNGGDCNNGIPPLKGTPIMLQKTLADAITHDGGPVQILDRDDSDGPLVEAPNLIYHGGTYFLFYSTHCFTDPLYDVRYATASSITGPYTKQHAILKTGDFGLTSPGGATVSGDGTKILFHANCPAGRCTYAGQVSISGTTVTVL